VFQVDDEFRIINGPEAEIRAPDKNELQFFFQSSMSLVPSSEGSIPTEVDVVRQQLRAEQDFFVALDGLLIGMDRDFPQDIRERNIRRTEHLLSLNSDLERRVRRRFLVPVNTQEWDPVGGLGLAQRASATLVTGLYRPLADGTVDRVADEIRVAVFERLKAGVEGAKAASAFIRSGLIGAFIRLKAELPATSASQLIFRKSEFDKLDDVDPNGQILSAVLRSIDSNTEEQLSNDYLPDERLVSSESQQQEVDPILGALEKALSVKQVRKKTSQKHDPRIVDNIQKEITWIVSKLESGRIVQAENGLVQLIENLSNRGEIKRLVKTLGVVADRARQVGESGFALRVLDLISYTNSGDVRVRTLKAEVLRDLGRFVDALAAYDLAIEQFPDGAFAQVRRASLLRDLGRFDEALETYDSAIEQFPDDAFAQSGRAEVLRDLGRFDDALTAYDRAIDRFPDGAFAQVRRASLLRDLGRFDEALETYDSAIEQFPDDAFAQSGRAEVLRDLGRFDEALAAYDRAIERFPGDRVVRNQRAEVLRDLGRFDDALAAYDGAIERFTDDTYAQNGRAEVLRDLGRFDDALTAYDRAIDRFPDDAVAQRGRAEVLRDLGRFDDALAAYDRAIDRFPDDAISRNGRAEVLRDLGRFDDALTAYDRAIDRFPDNAVARNGKGYLLGSMGQLKQLIEMLASAASTPVIKQDWIATHILGMAYLRAGDIESGAQFIKVGAERCPFAKQREIFRASQSLIYLMKSDAYGAVRELESLAKSPHLSLPMKRNVILFQSHALACAGKPDRAQKLLSQSVVVEFATERQKRLSRALSERYGLTGTTPRLFKNKSDDLDRQIQALEFELSEARFTKEPGGERLVS